MRVEPAEVEAALAEHPDVHRPWWAVASARAHSSSRTWSGRPTPARKRGGTQKLSPSLYLVPCDY